MNKARSKLAVLGGTPAFAEPLHVGRPNMGDRDRLLGRISRILETRWLSNGGPFVAEFEERVANLVGVKHCIATCNATVALEIVIRALELSGEVIVPSFTFVATAHALEWQQITPVFCDIDATSHNIDPQKVEALITPRTTGIIGVHLWGRPCEIESLQAIADRHHLKLVFDAAHALGCSHGGIPIGHFGCAEILSFHATKIVNAAEGGAVVTNDDRLANRVRLMKNFGFLEYDTVNSVGTNGKMNELSAVMGLTNLESLEDFVRVNRRNFETYQKCLDGLPGISLLTYDEQTSPNYHYVVLEVDQRRAGLTRDQFVSILHAENVLARRYFYPGVHRMEPYRSNRSNRGSQPLPVTETVAERVLVVPTGTGATVSDVETVSAIIRSAIDQGATLQRIFGQTAA